MFDEQIKSEIAKQIDNKFQSLKEFINPIETIIKNSEFRCLVFAGVAATPQSILSPRFDLNLIIGKSLLIKSIRFIPYAAGNVVDVSYSDGTTETVPNNMRLNRIMELWGTSLQPRLFINGQNVIFVELPSVSYYPGDLFMDNIYFLVKSKITDIDLRAGLQLVTDFAAAQFQSKMVVLMECYIF